jgi:inorganic pyrophosphatase/exopolyphosphatase
MIKKLTSFLDYGWFAEIALAIFALVFVAIVVRTLLMRRETTTKHAQIVLKDNEEPIT